MCYDCRRLLFVTKSQLDLKRAANSCGANNYSGIAFDSQLLRAPRMRQVKSRTEVHNNA